MILERHMKQERDAVIENIPKICSTCNHDNDWGICSKYPFINSDRENCSSWQWHGLEDTPCND